MVLLDQRSDDELRLRQLDAGVPIESLVEDADVWTIPDANSERYIAGFAASRRAVEQALRLRYEVFNLEMNEGLSSSHRTGLDWDPFDGQMTHLVVIERTTQRVVGTYRLQTSRKASENDGFYSAREYDLAPLEPMFEQLVECGRACIAKEHRNVLVLSMLWQGIWSYSRAHNRRWLFGCCSLTSDDIDDGWRAKKTLRSMGKLHETLILEPAPAFTCGDPRREFDSDLGDPIKLPKLFATYMRLGATAISEPAIDREFGTVDFLILLDVDTINPVKLVTGFLALNGKGNLSTP